MDLDSARAAAEPEAPRWDYLLAGERALQAVALEVHPAKASDVASMVAKKEWADSLLAREVPAVAVRFWEWVVPPGSKIQFTPQDPRARRLALAGIRFPCRLLAL